MAGPGDLDVSIRITADGSQAIVNIRRTEDATRNLGGAANGAADSMRSLTRGLIGMAAAATGIRGLAEMASSLVKIKDEAVRLDAAYKMIYGSAGAASDALAFVGDIANTAGINAGDAAKSFQSLAAAAQGTSMQGQVVNDIFGAVTLSMAKLGKNSFDTAGALKAIEQMMSKGKVMAEELRGQLGERLPGAFSMVARAMGVSNYELDKMMQLGQVTADEMLPKLAAELKKTYGGSEFAKTVAADFERLGNVITGPGGLAEAVNDAIGLNDGLMSALQGMTEAAKKANAELRQIDPADPWAGWRATADDVKNGLVGIGDGFVSVAKFAHESGQALAVWAGAAESSQPITLMDDLRLLGELFQRLPDIVRKATYAVASEIDSFAEGLAAAWEALPHLPELAWASIKHAAISAMAGIRRAVAEGVSWIAKSLADLAKDMMSLADKAAMLPGLGGFAKNLRGGLEDLSFDLWSKQVAYVWEQNTIANAMQTAADADLKAAQDAFTANATRLAGLDAYKQRARETAVELMELLDVERQRAAQAREEAALFAQLTAEQEQNTFSPPAPGATNDRLWSDIADLREQLVPGTKELREFNEAKQQLDKALAAGMPKSEYADLMVAATARYRAEIDKATGATERLKQSQTGATKIATDMIKQFEGLNLSAYWDNKGYSIGYGHQAPEIKAGMRIDIAQAEKWLKEDISKFEDVVRRVVTVSLSDNQAAALTSLAYNIGAGAFADSTLVKLLNMGDYEAAAEQFKEWNKVTVDGHKQASEGLTKRRALEEQVFNGAKSYTSASKQLAKEAADATKERVRIEGEALQELARAWAEIEQLAESYGTDHAAQKRYAQSLQDIERLLKTGRMTAEEYARALQDIRLEYQESQGPMAAYFAGLERDLQDGFEKIGVQAMDGFVNAIADGLVDGRFEFDDFVDDVKRSLARLAVNTIMVNIVGNILGVNGASGIQGALGKASGIPGAGGGGLDLSFDTLSKLGNMITGNSIGTSLAGYAQGIGNFFSGGQLAPGGAGGWGSAAANMASVPNWGYGMGALGSFAGGWAANQVFEGKHVNTGSAIGGTAGTIAAAAMTGNPLIIAAAAALAAFAGGGLGSLFGGDKTPRQGSFATSFSGYGFEDNAKAKGAFGLNFGLDDRYSKNIDGAQFQGFYDGMAQVSNTLAQFYGTDLATKVQVKLRESLGDFKGYGPGAASAFQEIFQRIVDAASQAEGDVGDGMGHLMKVAVGTLQGTTEQMAAHIENSMTKVKATIGLFDSDIGKLLGMGTGLYYADLEQSIAGLAGYIDRFRQGAETVPETITRIVTVVGALKSAMDLAGQSIKNLTGDELIRIGQQFTDTMASMGMSLQDLSSLQATYFDKFFTAEEKALKQRDAALAGIEAWNRQLGLSGDAMIDSSAEFRRYVESLDLLDPAQQAAYLSAMNMIGSFVSLDEALAALKGTTDGVIGSVKDFVDSIKPDEIKQADALKEMVDLFAGWGMQLPPTADALYALIQAGALNEKQIQALADKSDVLSLAWAALAAAQEAALKELQAAYDDAVAKAKEASQARIEALREESAARIDALRDAYDDQVKAATKAHQELIDGLNDKLSDARDALAIFQRVVESANDALRSLTEQTDGIDETRQRALAEARKALEDYKQTGKLPDNITDIIGGLGTVDPNDFASREDWLKAVEENKRVIEELKKIGVDGKSEAERQIELIEAQIEQANAQHEALLESLRENLDAAIKAEQDNLDKLIKAEEDALKAQLAALEAEFEQAKEDLMIDTNKLVAEANARLKEILDAILAGQKPVQPLPKDDKSASLEIPGFAAGGRHAGGLRIVGEQGPELEYTGPSVVAPNSDLGGLFRAGNSDVAEEIRILNREVRALRQVSTTQSGSLAALAKLHQRWNAEGMPADRDDYLKTLAEVTP